MRSSGGKQVRVVHTTFRNEMYDCIQNPSATTTSNNNMAISPSSAVATCTATSSSQPQHAQNQQLRSQNSKEENIYWDEPAASSSSTRKRSSSTDGGNPGGQFISHEPQYNSSKIFRGQQDHHHHNHNNHNGSSPNSNGSNGSGGRRPQHHFEISSSPHNSHDSEEDDRHHHHQSHNDDDDDDNNSTESHNNNNRPSNENLLGTAFVTFMGFALIQTVVAFFAKSEAMLGDSAAMIVDALTYLFNWVAEHKKKQYDNHHHHHQYDHNLHHHHQQQQHHYQDGRPIPIEELQRQDRERHQRIIKRTRRKMVLQLELLPPLISVTTLIVVTAVVLHNSVRVLMLDAHRSRSQQGNPNILVMIYFSIANLGLDLLNVANFAKAKHLFGYETNDKPPEGHEALSGFEESSDRSEDDSNHLPATITVTTASSSSSSLSNHQNGTTGGVGLHRHHHDDNNNEEVGHYSRPSHSKSHDEEDDEDQDHEANLNMCSAYTVRNNGIVTCLSRANWRLVGSKMYICLVVLIPYILHSMYLPTRFEA